MICVALHGYPVIGVVHQPFLSRTFWSWSSYAMSDDLKRAMQNGSVAFQKEAMSVPKNTDNKSVSNSSARNLVVTHSRSHLDASQLTKLFEPQTVELVPAGGSGYKVLSLIERKAQLYVHPSSTRRWDVCAAQAILEATGGRLTGLDGTRLTYYAGDPEIIPKTTGLFAASSISEHKKWLPLTGSLLERN
ncbi:Inositol monophosphatase domain-containing protein [Fasciola hepatica]|uniref:3'(2'),5'-bisphosphate nucleotidase 1 n=1 Tax=Fasciola hepatica TaxID=6192 RepID=A0A4E0R1Z9_FASHE|nr:Inositol monophosphatase domain-containing protein [Fasciola hepatica]